MITPQSQIKLNLPINLKEFLEAKAKRYGIPMSDYLKHLILKDVEGEEYPTFEPSEETIKAAKRATKDLKAGKSVVINNQKELKDFFKNL